MPTEFKKQTAETRGKMQAEVKIKYEELKTRGSSRDQMIDMGVFIRRYTCTRNFISKIPKTQVKRHFLALVKHYLINLGFLISPFCRTKFATRARTSHNSMHLTLADMSAILNIFCFHDQFWAS